MSCIWGLLLTPAAWSWEVWEWPRNTHELTQLWRCARGECNPRMSLEQYVQIGKYYWHHTVFINETLFKTLCMVFISIRDRWPETEACLAKGIGIIRGMDGWFYKQRLEKVGLLDLARENLGACVYRYIFFSKYIMAESNFLYWRPVLAEEQRGINWRGLRLG